MLRALNQHLLGVTLLLMFCAHTASAQTLAQREFTIQDGLVQSQVDYVYKDSRGYLWIATRGGLNCFNGQTIKTFNAPRQLSGIKFKAIEEDEKGYLYFLNQNGVFRFDGVSFQQIIPPDKRYRSLNIDEKGRLWLIAHTSPEYDNLIEIYDLNSLSKVDHPLVKENDFFKDQRWFRIFEGHDGQFVIGANFDSWNLLKPDGETVSNQPFEYILNYFLKSICKKNGGFECDFNIGSEFFKENEIDSSRFFINYIKFPNHPFEKHKNEILYINDETHELKHINFKNRKVASFDMGRNEAFYRAYIEKDEEIWVGLEMGLIQLFNSSQLNYNLPELNLCWNILGLPNNKTLFANLEDEIIVLEEDVLKKFTNNCNPDRTTFYMGNHRLSDGRILLACNKGLCVLDSNYNCTSHTRDSIQYGHSTTSQHLSVNKEETEVLTATFSGMDRFLISDSNIVFDKYLPFDDKDLKHIYANAIFIDENDYWVGHEKGLSIYSKNNSTWKHFSIENNTFPAGDVACIYKDPDGNYWLGTAHGLVVGNEKDGFRRIDDPLIFGVVNAIDSFDANHIILGGSFGICVLNMEEYYKSGKLVGKIFNQSNGFTAGEPAENSIYRLPDGSFMVGTQSHPVQLFPDQMDLSVTPLRTRITRINDTLIPFTVEHAKIDLPYKTNDIRLDFEAIGMYRPSPTRYSYQLNNGEWSDWQKESFIELNNIGSGNHTLALKAQTPGIDFSLQPISHISFATSVPIWMEPYLSTLLGILLLVSVILIGFMVFLNNRQRKRNRKNAYAIDYLRIQSLQAQMNPHFVFNVLGTLQNMILKKNVKKANEQLVNLSTLIRRFLESTVHGNLNVNQTNIKEQSLDKELELLELYLQFEQVQHEDVFDYTIELDPKLDPESYSIPPMLIQPFVENAVKHGLMYKPTKGSLKIKFYPENNKLICIIEDNGVGRKKAREIQKNSLRLYTSYGTKLVEERISLLNKMDYQIEYFIEDLPEGGTQVIIKLGS